MSDRLKFTLLLLIPGTLWGIAFPLNAIILESIPPITLTLVRGLLAGVPLVVYFLWRGGRMPQSLAEWWPFVVLGMLNNAIPFVLTSWGQLHIPSSLTTILIALMPIFTIVIAWLVSAEGESFHTLKVIGVTLGFSGIIVLVGPSALRGVSTSLLAQLAVIASAVSYAVAAIYSRNVLKSLHDGEPLLSIVQMVGLQYVSSTLFLLPMAFAIEQIWLIRPTQTSINAMLMLAWPITLGAVIVYYVIIDQAGASIGSTTVYFIPIAGVFASALMLDEDITRQAITALGLILIGIALTNTKPPQEQAATTT